MVLELEKMRRFFARFVSGGIVPLSAMEFLPIRKLAFASAFAKFGLLAHYNLDSSLKRSFEVKDLGEIPLRSLRNKDLLVKY
jgi:hypothetical protein